MHTVTLKQIIDYNPCLTGMIRLLKGLEVTNKKELVTVLQKYVYMAIFANDKNLLFRRLTEEELNRPITLKFILENNGIRDALWCLQLFQSTKEWWNLKADILELVMPSISLNREEMFIEEYVKRLTQWNTFLFKYPIAPFVVLLEDHYHPLKFYNNITSLFTKYFCQEE